MKKNSIQIPEGYRVILDRPNYCVNNVGDIFNLKLKKFLKISVSKDCGYKRIALYDKHKTKSYRIHSLVAEYFIGTRPEGYQVNHIDGNKTNNHVSNLEYVTRKGNSEHAVKIGLIKSLHAHWDKEQLIKDYRVKTIKEIAKDLGCNKCTVFAQVKRLLSKEELKEISLFKQRTKNKKK
jgi:hypothetical protein